MDPKGEVILYGGDDGGSVVQLRSSGGTVWLTHGELATLYGTSLPNIVQIVRRILADSEVGESTANSELVARQEGRRQVRREVKIYNLDMILAVGYRVTTPRAVQFRQWATTVLKGYLVKGFAPQDERLKDPSADYFDELLERIWEIRASERRFYQKVRDVFATTSADYSASDTTAKTFFATIQNKLLYAVTGHTAAELITARADPDAPNMGLTSWKGTLRKVEASGAVARVIPSSTSCAAVSSPAHCRSRRTTGTGHDGRQRHRHDAGQRVADPATSARIGDELQHLDEARRARVLFGLAGDRRGWHRRMWLSAG